MKAYRNVDKSALERPSWMAAAYVRLDIGLGSS